MTNMITVDIGIILMNFRTTEVTVTKKIYCFQNNALYYNEGENIRLGKVDECHQKEIL